MTTKTVIQIIIGVALAGSAAAALQLPVSSVSERGTQSPSVERDAGVLAFPLPPVRNAFVAGMDSATAAHTAVRRLVR